MTRLLKKNQCEVDVAENGQVGLSKLETSTYDIVLVDFEMPVMTGPGNTYINKFYLVCI
jgi:CheY-like chemotaxis protein